MKRVLLSLSLFILFTGAIFSQSSHDQVSELYELAIQLRADEGSLYRFYHIDYSPERRARYLSFYNDYMNRLEANNFNQLSQAGKVDYILIKYHIEDRIHRLQTEEKEYNQIYKWLDFADPIYEIEKKRRRGLHLDSPKLAGSLHEIGKSIDEYSSRIKEEKPVFSRNIIRAGTGAIEGHLDALKSVYEFYAGYDPEFTWWLEKPYASLSEKLKAYSELLETRVDSTTLPPDDGSGIIGNPMGKEELVRLLRSEMIPYGPEELVNIAMKEFEWCDRELLKASREMGFGDDWKAAQEKVKQSYVPPGYQPEAMLDLYNQSVDFLKDHDLISIPPIAEETWRMSMIPPERQLISPFFLGGEVLQISYPTDDMEHPDKLMSMRGNNPHFSRSTVHHELIAGHHLQGFMNRRYKDYRFYRTPFWTEGWALYWELLLWDMDFPRSPEDRIGMLFWRMHRCARIIFSLNYHLGEWTPQQCIDYLVDRVGHERANAEGEVRRSFTANYGPLYQIAYMVGGLQFWELKRELVDSGKMSYKEFHDAVMRENSMPVEMVRAMLMETELDKDFKTQWKFYNK